MRHTYTTSITLLRDYIQNSDVAEAKLQTLLNMGNTRSRMALGIHKVRGTSSFKISDTDTHENKYFLPPKAAKPVSVVIDVGGTRYPIWPIESQMIFDTVNASNISNDQPTNYLYNGRAIQFYPTPSAEHDVHVIFEEVEKPLSNADVTSGTVEILENNSTEVTFTGDPLSGWMKNTGWFRIDTDGYWYKIADINTDATPHKLTLEQPYLGTTINASTAAADKAYTIGEQFDLPDEMQEAPVLWAAHRYFQVYRRNQEMRKEMGDQWIQMMDYGIGKYGPRTSIKVMKSKLRTLLGSINTNDFPTIPTTEL